MPVFKEIENATQQLIAIREVAEGKMSHPELTTQEKAQAIYQKYGPTIDRLIEMGSQYQYLAAMGMASKEMKDSKFENVVLQVGGKSLVILGAPVTFFSNMFGGNEKINLKDAWNAPNDIINAKQKAIQNYNNALKDVQNCYINIGKDFAQIADAIMEDNAAKLDNALAHLKINIKSLEGLGKKLGLAMYELNLSKANVDGATGVIKAFVTDVVLTIATMEATSAATSVVSKGLAEVAPKVTGAGKVFNTIRKIGELPHADKFYKGVKFGLKSGKTFYKVEHAVHNLEKDLNKNEKEVEEAQKENEKAYRDFASKIAAR